LVKKQQDKSLTGQFKIFKKLLSLHLGTKIKLIWQKKNQK